MVKLVVESNPKAPETGSLYILFKDGEKGYVRFVKKCEMDLIEKDGFISREPRECPLVLLSS
ncbi:MAG: hypothetical protein ACXQTS_03850 [Candidatus Methanospirareceae archaeon]